MEPITTTAAISTVVGYLAKKLVDNKSVQSFFDDFTSATVNWIKPIFIRNDGTLKDVLKDLQEKPESLSRQDVAKSAIVVALEDNPSAEVFLKEMANVIETKKSRGEEVSIQNSKNVVTGSVTAGGHAIIGDNNHLNK